MTTDTPDAIRFTDAYDRFEPGDEVAVEWGGEVEPHIAPKLLGDFAEPVTPDAPTPDGIPDRDE